MIHPQCWPRAPHQQNPALVVLATKRLVISLQNTLTENTVLQVAENRALLNQ